MIGALVLTSRKKAAFSPAHIELTGVIADFVTGLVGAEVDIATTVARLQAYAAAHSTGTSRDASVKLANFASHTLGQGFVEDAAARCRIAEVIADKAVAIVCQPIVDLASGKVVAVEALSRFPGQPERSAEMWFSEASLVGLSEELELTSLQAALKIFPLLAT